MDAGYYRQTESAYGKDGGRRFWVSSPRVFYGMGKGAVFVSFQHCLEVGGLSIGLRSPGRGGGRYPTGPMLYVCMYIFVAICLVVVGVPRQAMMPTYTYTYRQPVRTNLVSPCVLCVCVVYPLTG